jgi:hypothetical protein
MKRVKEADGKSLKFSTLGCRFFFYFLFLFTETKPY